MTQIVEELVKCGACGKGNQVSVMTSYSSFGSCDLDTRPPAMFPYTIYLQECSHCGYVAPEIAEENKGILEFLDSEMYKTCDGIEPVDNDARRYIQYALIQAHNKVSSLLDGTGTNSTQEDIFWGYMNAAWACDDCAENDKKNSSHAKEDAVVCRKRCLDLINALIVGMEDPEEKEGFIGIKADLLRRTGQFDALIVEYENRVFQSPVLNQIIKFQLARAKERDDKRYNMDHVRQTENA